MSELTPAEITAWLGLPEPSGDPAALTPALTMVHATATATVGKIVGTTADVPADVVKHATLALISDLWEQRNAPNGIRLFVDDVGGAAPMRVRADSAARAKAILAPFLPVALVI